MTIAGPDQISKITDEITKGLTSQTNLERVTQNCHFCWFAIYHKWTIRLCTKFYYGNVTQKFSKKMRNEISSKINKLPLKYFDNHSYGDTLSRVTNDVDTIGQSMNQKYW